MLSPYLSTVDYNSAEHEIPQWWIVWIPADVLPPNNDWGGSNCTRHNNNMSYCSNVFTLYTMPKLTWTGWIGCNGILYSTVSPVLMYFGTAYSWIGSIPGSVSMQRFKFRLFLGQCTVELSVQSNSTVWAVTIRVKTEPDPLLNC